MTRIKQITEKVNNTPLIKDWKDKLYSKIDYDKRSCGYALTQDTVITYATDMIFDYHDKIHNGNLYHDNRNPNDKDIEVFVEIMIAVLYEVGIIDGFEDYTQLYSSLKTVLKKRIVADNRYE